MIRLVALTDEQIEDIDILFASRVRPLDASEKSARAKLRAALDADPEALVETVARAIAGEGEGYDWDTALVDDVVWREKAERTRATARAVVAALTGKEPS